MSRTRIKICGLTRVEDTRLACDLGADAIGLNFYPGSKLFLSTERALPIRAAMPAFVSAVGLFVNAGRGEVEAVLEALHLDCLQFHGDESPEFCRSFSMPYMKVIRVREGLDIKAEISKYSDSSAILLDSFDKNVFGGTGLRFDWEVARRCVQDGDAKIVLAGGLMADNVATAIEQVRPYAVDVSSGVESAPGVKCAQRLTAFFDEVNRV